jgi:signal transduction histidine kinase
MISVKDNGLGIEAEALPHIFDAFYADHEVYKAKAGMGMGLWLTRNLVELHAGTIAAKSEGLGQGTKFCVTIPLRH